MAAREMVSLVRITACTRPSCAAATAPRIGCPNTPTQPAELMLAVSTCHVIAAAVLLNGIAALGTRPRTNRGHPRRKLNLCNHDDDNNGTILRRRAHTKSTILRRFQLPTLIVGTHNSIMPGFLAVETRYKAAFALNARLLGGPNHTIGTIRRRTKPRIRISIQHAIR